MPTATPFTALGAGNGFPFCLTKVDVSGYDHWTTFSGVNKDSPTTSDALIAESLAIGMNLYWNTFSCVAPTSSSFTGSTGNTSSSVSYLDVSSSARGDPHKRVCGRVVANEKDNNGSSYAEVYINFAGGNFVAKMYDGVTTDEGNLVGYGFYSGSLILTRGAATTRARSRVNIQGFMNETPTTAAIDYAYVELGGAHFACEASAFGNDTQSADAASLTASATGSRSGNTYSSTSTITSFDLYTY